MLVVMEVPPNNPDCPQCKLLLEQIKRLEQRLEAVEREGQRQAAPFRKKRKPLPKKPGRKKGDDYGKHQRRVAPATIDETYDVPLHEACPDCGETNLTETEPVVQCQTDIPRTVIKRQFNIATGVCCGCGGALSFPRRVRELLLHALEMRERYRRGAMRLESVRFVPRWSIEIWGGNRFNHAQGLRY
jgi:hypothetical protein